MTLRIHLLGRPWLERPAGDVYVFRSRKSWALIAYLLLTGTAPSRQRLAALLFAEADDPLGALRWHLSEIRRGLAADGTVEGDPVQLTLVAGVEVDAAAISSSDWEDAVAWPGLDEELLAGVEVRGAPAFSTWLLAERHRLRAATGAVRHEAALRCMSRGALTDALDHAVRAATCSPLEEDHHALVIRLYRLLGDDGAAEQQYAALTDVLQHELGVAPGPVATQALALQPAARVAISDVAMVEALTEAGVAAVDAGSVEAGVRTLRQAAALADRSGDARLRLAARLPLAEALIHSLRGFDEEGVAILHEADEIATASGAAAVAADVRAELGYVDFLQARYDRAQRWLREALHLAGDVASHAKATTYLAAVASDVARYDDAVGLLAQATTAAQDAGDARRIAYALTLAGRLHLLRGEIEPAETALARAERCAEDGRWLAFLPWPQALRGEAHLAAGDVTGARRLLERAFARACGLGDPCWEGEAARGLALVEAAAGDTDRALEWLLDARQRCRRFPDPYRWLQVSILDTMCDIGRRSGHPRAAEWIDLLCEQASRTGMRELTARGLLHAAAIGRPGAREAAQLLSDEIDNPLLHRLLAAAA